MTGTLVYILAFLFYTFAGWYFWQTRWKHQSVFSVKQRNDSSQEDWPAHLIMLAPITLHGLTLSHSIFIETGLSFGVGNAISSIVWLTGLIYWFTGFFPRLQGLQNLFAPIAIVGAVAVLLPLVIPSARPLANTEMTAFKMHLLVAMLAYSLFTIAALHALLMTIQEYRLHHPTLAPLLTNLPPLLAMEKLLFHIIWTGFVL